MKKLSTLIFVLVLWGCNKSDKDSNSFSQETSSKSCTCVSSATDDLNFFTAEFLSEFSQPAVAKVETHKHKTFTTHSSIWQIDGTAFHFSIEEIEVFKELKEKRKSLFKNKPDDWTMVDYVQNTYKSITKEEADKYEEMMKEEANKQNEAMTKQDEAIQDKLQSSLLAMQQSAYVAIDNLGDYAVYNKKSNDLYVVCGEILFHVRGQVGPWGSHDKEKGLELAKKVMEKIIRQCQ